MSLFSRLRKVVAAESERAAAIREMREESDAYLASIRRPQAEVDQMMADIRRRNHEAYERLVQRKIAERRARAK